MYSSELARLMRPLGFIVESRKTASMLSRLTLPTEAIARTEFLHFLRAEIFEHFGGFVVAQGQHQDGALC